ncbi:rhythmically expressed gene 2 protein-like [Wyeomyia smithii]|uniref:rhythmically expressed gene 2 protein-like n=1 Tax=Wyeomyia smithii TaxID=174621 RepID=UPI002467CBC2|nr:rhythmically expressed gene 2 protein-like [Wyeomyia smithii]
MAIGIGSSRVAQNLGRFKLVTFDVTDTLLKFSRPPEVQYAMAARLNGCTGINEQALAECFRTHFKRMARNYPNFGKSSGFDWRWWWRSLVMDIFRDSHTHIDETMLRRVADQLIENYKTKDCWTKVSLANEIVEIAKACQKHVGIISNFDPRLGDILEAMALPKVDFVLTSYDADSQKPCCRIFDLALSKCNTHVLPNEALHIGNTPKLDYMESKSAGWSSALVNVTLEAEREISLNSEINPKHVFKNFDEFIHVLESTEVAW